LLRSADRGRSSSMKKSQPMSQLSEAPRQSAVAAPDRPVGYLVDRLWTRDGNGLGLGRIPAGFGSCGFGFADDFSPMVFCFGFGFGIGFGFGFGFHPWISNGYPINHLELKLMFYNMLIIAYLLRLLNLFKIDS
jgi:hypothetical protein